MFPPGSGFRWSSYQVVPPHEPSLAARVSFGVWGIPPFRPGRQPPGVLSRSPASAPGCHHTFADTGIPLEDVGGAVGEKADGSVTYVVTRVNLADIAAGRF